jgi:hypothetical protein
VFDFRVVRGFFGLTTASTGVSSMTASASTVTLFARPLFLTTSIVDIMDNSIVSSVRFGLRNVNKTRRVFVSLRVGEGDPKRELPLFPDEEPQVTSGTIYNSTTGYKKEHFQDQHTSHSS